MALVTGTLTLAGQSSNVFTPQQSVVTYSAAGVPLIYGPGVFNIKATLAGTGTFQVYRDIGDGDPQPISSLGTAYTFSNTINETWTEPQAGVKYTIVAGAGLSGSIKYAFGQ